MIKIVGDEIFFNETKVGSIDYIPSANIFDLEEYFIDTQKFRKESFEKIKSRIENKVCLLKHIQIEPEHQQKGYGTEVLNLLKKDATSILLLAELNKDHVMNWYSKHDFDTIHYELWMPVMIYSKTL